VLREERELEPLPRVPLCCRARIAPCSAAVLLPCGSEAGSRCGRALFPGRLVP